MYELIGSLIIGAAKLYFQYKAGKKLSDAEFMEHIEAHQRKRAGVGRQSREFEDNMTDAFDEMTAEIKEEKKNNQG